MKYYPSEKQKRFMEWEFGVFFHFGIRTFNHGHRDWDGREMEAASFDPASLDCRQWCRFVKEIGGKYCILTTKHHDGFANWPSKYTKYSVAASPWKDGKGDVVREFTDACREYGLGVGLYYSPAQWGSTAVEFKDGREYDDYFINQISELLSNYGRIDYLWFDGCGSAGHKYDEKRIIGVIRGLQPDIIIFGMWDPDTVWIGNEDGYADMPNSNVRTYERLGESVTGFVPAECDTRLRDSWFYDINEHTVKSLDELVGIYEMSVGRGSNLLLNIGPDDRGLLPDADMRRLYEWRREIDKRYGFPLGFGSFQNVGHGVYSLSYTKEQEALVNDTVNIPYVRSVVISEDICGGDEIKEFRLYAHIPSRNPVSDKKYCVCSGYTVGRKRICRFPAVRTLKFTLETSGGENVILDMKAYE